MGRAMDIYMNERQPLMYGNSCGGDHIRAQKKEEASGKGSEAAAPRVTILND